MGIDIKKIIPLSKISSKEFIGIDISGSTLKIACVKVSPSKREIVSLLHRTIEGLSDEHISQIILASFDELKLKSPQVIVTVPSHPVITKNIEIPSTDPQEIRDIISLQAERHTPYTREEIIVDYIDLGSYRHSYSKILLAIVARKVVERQLKQLDKTGFRAGRVSFAPESYGVFFQKFIKLESGDSPVNIIHIDQDSTDFTIILKNKVLFVRSIPIGSKHFVQERTLYRKTFCEELKKSLEVYQGEDIEKNPNLCILTGAVEELKDLEIVLSNSLHLSVKTLPYLKNLQLSSALLNDASFTKQVSFLNVIAPVFVWQETKINLIPEEIKVRKSIEERGKELIKTGIMALTVFILFFSIFLVKIYFKSVYVKILDEKYQSLDGKAQKLKNDFSRVSVIKSYLLKRGLSLEALTELYAVMPLGIQINEIRFDEQGKFSLKGAAESMPAVFSFIDNMSKSKYFKDVKTKHTTKRKEGLRDLTDFEINTIINKDALK